jgi:hypothetical protein
MQGRAGIEATTETCELHADHVPTPMYCELHHIIPRAWQAFWSPPTPPHPGIYKGQKLWDARTVVIDRTGHGNVHFWITALMHNFRPWEPGWAFDNLLAFTRKEVGHAGGKADVNCACEALTRWMDSGGSLADLVANGLWGQI